MWLGLKHELPALEIGDECGTTQQAPTFCFLEAAGDDRLLGVHTASVDTGSSLASPGSQSRAQKVRRTQDAERARLLGPKEAQKRPHREAGKRKQS